MELCYKEGEKWLPVSDLYQNQANELREEIKELKETIEFYRKRPPMTNAMIFWAFRYCLGKSTYAVQDCIGYLLLYWDRIDEKVRGHIIREIFEACGKKDCKIEMDKSQWHCVLERAGVKAVLGKDFYHKITIQSPLKKEEKTSGAEIYGSLCHLFSTGKTCEGSPGYSCHKCTAYNPGDTEDV